MGRARNKETRIQRWARSWKSNSAEEDEDATFVQGKKQQREKQRKRNGKFTTGMRMVG